MSESTQQTSPFVKELAKTNLPPQALEPIQSALDEALRLTLENNKRVAQVNAAKAQDPSNVEYLDSLWKANELSDPAIRELAEKFYVVAEEYEKLNGQLRERAKKHIPAQLSEEQTQKTRKLVNESAKAIEEARKTAAHMAVIADQMLELNKAGIEGGIISLLPSVDSLKSGRGRKSGTGEKGPYMTRVADITIDGKSTNKEGRGKFNFAADALSKMWGAAQVPENAVSVGELEEAYYDSLGIEFRDTSNLPATHTFEFEKTLKFQNGADGTVKSEPRKVKVTVIRPDATAAAKSEEAKPESKPESKPAEAAKTPAQKQNAQPANAKK